MEMVKWLFWDILQLKLIFFREQKSRIYRTTIPFSFVKELEDIDFKNELHLLLF